MRRVTLGQSIADIFQGGQNASRAYWTDIYKAVAEETAKVTGGNADHIQVALSNPAMHDSELLKDILKIDYTASKISPTICKTEIVVWVVGRDDTNNPVSVKITLESNVPWDGLPAQVREGFIKNGGKEQKLTLFERIQE